jgi:hypothetical protein
MLSCTYTLVKLCVEHVYFVGDVIVVSYEVVADRSVRR